MNDKKTDFTFIVSLIGIIIVAIYLYINRFGDSSITDYLQKTGQDLLAQVANQEERQQLESSYAELLNKIENKEVRPEDVEFLTSNLINLKQINESIAPEDVEIIFRAALDSINNNTPAEKINVDDKKWKALQKRITAVTRLENHLKQIESSDNLTDGKGRFNYAIDDSLNIIISQEQKNKLLESRHEDVLKELEALEKKKQLKWSENLDLEIEKQHNQVKININGLKKQLKKLSREIPKISVEFSPENQGSYSFSSIDSNGSFAFEIIADSISFDSIGTP